jgi:hypothetical protein
MRKYFFVLVALAAILIVTGCGSKSGVNVSLGQGFTLSIGQTASIKAANLDVTFAAVVEDSRCPTGVQCFWQGRARSLVKLTSGNISQDVELLEPGLTGQAASQQFLNYTISFHLLPYPEAGKKITDNQYRLNLTVNSIKEFGTLEGEVTIGPLTPVQTIGTQPPVPCQVYEARKILVYDSGKTNLLQQVDIDCTGHYSAELQPGSYTVDINHNGIDRSFDVPKPVQIKSGETVTLNISIDTGIR